MVINMQLTTPHFVTFLKMWRQLPGVSIPNKQDVKETPQKADSREYEKTRLRKFSLKWQVGRLWLKDDENGMTCEWCMEANKP